MEANREGEADDGHQAAGEEPRQGVGKTRTRASLISPRAASRLRPAEFPLLGCEPSGRVQSFHPYL